MNMIVVMGMLVQCNEYDCGHGNEPEQTCHCHLCQSQDMQFRTHCICAQPVALGMGEGISVTATVFITEYTALMSSKKSETVTRCLQFSVSRIHPKCNAILDWMLACTAMQFRVHCQTSHQDGHHVVAYIAHCIRDIIYRHIEYPSRITWLKGSILVYTFQASDLCPFSNNYNSSFQIQATHIEWTITLPPIKECLKLMWLTPRNFVHIYIEPCTKISMFAYLILCI